ncbi:hypothetical protein [Nocardioides sp. W7]|uniref:TRAFAC clade GTPase domain-containing protein n=1 Tax=Nocardioides sp. W7 TaxID=2931390 RepID=UPI001FD62809|nr:hypothetical protein [Nocardioides sp. W7]
MALFDSKVPCPYCYTRINVSKLAYRCSGMKAAGKDTCEPAVDARRQDHFTDGQPRLPVITAPDGSDLLGRNSVECGTCGSTQNFRVCPECHHELPHGFGPDSPLFGLVGVRGSGKTVLLSALHRELEGPVAARFRGSVSTVGQSKLVDSFETWARALSTGGSLPDQTAAVGIGRDAKQTPAVYEWREPRTVARISRDRATVLSFYDNAGEDVSTQDAVLSRAYLAASSGMVLLLDPFTFPENLRRAEERRVELPETGTPESVLDAITYLLRAAHGVKQSRKIKQPLAVVITKIDAFFDQIPAEHPLRQPSSTAPAVSRAELQTVHDHVALMIDQWGGSGLLRKLDANYESFRLFGASALGSEPDYAARRAGDRGFLPHRVAEPVLWLLAERGIVQAVD